MRLDCFKGRCSLTMLTLNQCVGDTFAPKIERASTDEGNLKVTKAGNSLRLEHPLDNAVGQGNLKLLFTYVPESPTATRVVGFSGGYLLDSKLRDEVRSTEYVPFPTAYNFFKLRCSVVSILGLERPDPVTKVTNR